MKKLLTVIFACLLPLTTQASGGGHNPLMMKAHNDLKDQASLQNGARLFVNYCLSCHSASYMRYNRMAKDLGMTDQQVAENLMFTTDKVGETMDIAMKRDDAANFFGAAPPDLSVIARSRGTDWLYSYLMTFYLDDSRPNGVNNAIFKDVGMPHVLWRLQGLQKPVYEEHEKEGGDTEKVLVGLEKVTDGTMSDKEFSHAMRDLTNYLDYMGEPIKLERHRLGFWVIAFLLLGLVFAYLVKKEYWKDIH